MHRDNGHGHHDHAHGDDAHGHDHRPGHAGHNVGMGHNHAPLPRGVAQWQTPHFDPHEAEPHAHGEPDLDQVEAAFIEGLMTASDPTSFLRLAGIPFTMTAADGAALSLLRVETEVVADIGSVTPHLGGGSFRYDPLPQPLVARRRRLRFVYFDGATLRKLSFADARIALAKALDHAMPTTPPEEVAPDRNCGEMRTK